MQYYKKNQEIFEINDKWDFYCNEALHNHYRSIVKNFDDKLCLECGCGGGYESALMARDGARVAVLDYSENALNYAKIVSNTLGVADKTKFICEDFFRFKEAGQYDLVWNCGMLEHYRDEKIIELINKMILLAKEGGLIAITVPNLLSPQSIFWMLTEGKGSERYLGRKKLVQTLKKSGLEDIEIRNLNFWLPSFLPYKWAVKTSKIKALNNLNFFAWLFTAVGKKPAKH